MTEFNERLHLLLDDMRETLEESGGVGLAAPQVGILRRVCIVEDSEGEIIELVNPEIVKAEGEQTGLEAVSYTHLDVYKRQRSRRSRSRSNLSKRPARGSRTSSGR